MDNMAKRIKSFHEWLDDNGFSIVSFAAKTGLGVGTVASLRSKSRHGIRTIMHSGTACRIRERTPDCPLLQTAVIM